MSVATAAARTEARAIATPIVDRKIVAAAACAGVCLLMSTAPFEALAPLLRVPGQAFSSVETVLLIVFAVWLVASARARALPELRAPLAAPWLAWIGASALAAAAAPANHANAFHMVGRMSLALGVFLLAANAATSIARVRTMLVAAAGAAALVSGLVLLEYLSVRPALVFLRLFRSSAAVIGAQVRAGGPFQYPTIASMYLEVLFALVLGLVPGAILSARRARLILLVGLLALVAEAITLTFTRAGLLTIAASMALAIALRIRRFGFDAAAKALVVVAILVVAEILASRSVEALRLRLTTEGQDAWYVAEFSAPDEIEIATGGRAAVPITLTNAGRVTWDPDAAQPFRLSYHWLLPAEDTVVSWEGLRTELPAPVPPGTSVSMQALVEAPREPGAYRLVWDIEQVDQLWFSTEPDAELQFSRATVSGRPLPGPPITLRPMPLRAERPGRLTLWRAAIRMIGSHPITGIGPDNFRLTYGDYARVRRPDPRVHSNNMYLEVFAGSGAIGAAAFMWLCWRAGRSVRAAALRPSSDALAAYGAATATAVVAVALHGLVDSFLSFTPTYVLIAIVLGLVSGCASLNTHHADCV